jgi:hypothetical protein
MTDSRFHSLENHDGGVDNISYLIPLDIRAPPWLLLWGKAGVDVPGKYHFAFRIPARALAEEASLQSLLIRNRARRYDPYVVQPADAFDVQNPSTVTQKSRLISQR